MIPKMVGDELVWMSVMVRWKQFTQQFVHVIIRICQVEGQTWILLETLERALRGVLDQFCPNTCYVQVEAFMSKEICEDKFIVWCLSCVR